MPLDQPPSSAERLGDEVRMSFGEHLEELRWRLILALVGVGVASLGTLYIGREIVAWLVQPLAQVLRAQGLAPQTIFLAPTGAFSVYLKVSLVGGLVLASPWVIYQLWKFIGAGLYQHERKVMLVIAPFSGLMSLLGVLFMYYLMLPVCLIFLIGFSAGYPAPKVVMEEPGGVMAWVSETIRSSAGVREAEPGEEDAPPAADAEPPALVTLPVLQEDPADPAPGQAWIKLPERELHVFFGGAVHAFSVMTGQSLVQPQIEVGEYIGFVVMLTLGILLAFQLPVVMLVLGWSGAVDPAIVPQYRKYCVFGCFALGAVFTPADPISMFVLAVPLWLLFELGLVLMRLVYRPVEVV